MLDSLVRVSTGQLRPFCQLPVSTSPATLEWSSHPRHNMLSHGRTYHQTKGGEKKREEYPPYPARRSKEARQAATSKASPAQNREADERNTQCRTRKHERQGVVSTTGRNRFPHSNFK